MNPRIVFLHGLESGPHGSKYQALSALAPGVMAPDCTGIFDLKDRLAVIERELAGIGRMILVGSSFGGLSALRFAQERGNRERVVGCVLCAPALNMDGAAEIRGIPEDTVIIHGTEDDVVPIRFSEDLHARFGGTLIRVDDGHRLELSRDRIVAEVAAMLSRAGGHDAR